MNNQPLNSPLSAWFRALESGARGRWHRVVTVDPYLAQAEPEAGSDQHSQRAEEPLEDRSQGHGISGLSAPTFEERVKQAALKQYIRRRGGI